MTGKGVSFWTRITNFVVIPDLDILDYYAGVQDAGDRSSSKSKSKQEKTWRPSVGVEASRRSPAIGILLAETRSLFEPIRGVLA
ncbi:unnamed protein product [Amoebophrya sp. A120]|nr:unnamed protein product [Amoebophrya sp. A120]|eukprot:GSA120T00025516001.1